jgi:hypothetical protein
VEKTLHASPETDVIRLRMEEVRCELDEDVQVIVEGARDMGEWRYYVRTYPWVFLGSALAVGYLIVPRRAQGMQSDAQSLAELANQSRLLATASSTLQGGAGRTLLEFLGNLAMRGVLSYVGQQADKLFVNQPARTPQNDQP